MLNSGKRLRSTGTAVAVFPQVFHVLSEMLIKMLKRAGDASVEEKFPPEEALQSRSVSFQSQVCDAQIP